MPRLQSTTTTTAAREEHACDKIGISPNVRSSSPPNRALKSPQRRGGGGGKTGSGRKTLHLVGHVRRRGSENEIPNIDSRKRGGEENKKG